MGARADHWPCETQTVTVYVAEQFPQGFREPMCTVKVLAVERTFWEKATILHAEFHRAADKPMPKRFSRHYCDFFELLTQEDQVVAKVVPVKPVATPDFLARAKAVWGENPEGKPLSTLASDARGNGL